jgi:hypothetical protein
MAFIMAEEEKGSTEGRLEDISTHQSEDRVGITGRAQEMRLFDGGKWQLVYPSL